MRLRTWKATLSHERGLAGLKQKISQAQSRLEVGSVVALKTQGSSGSCLRLLYVLNHPSHFPLIYCLI